MEEVETVYKAVPRTQNNTMTNRIKIKYMRRHLNEFGVKGWEEEKVRERERERADEDYMAWSNCNSSDMPPACWPGEVSVGACWCFPAESGRDSRGAHMDCRLEPPLPLLNWGW